MTDWPQILTEGSSKYVEHKFLSKLFCVTPCSQVIGQVQKLFTVCVRIIFRILNVYSHTILYFYVCRGSFLEFWMCTAIQFCISICVQGVILGILSVYSNTILYFYMCAGGHSWNFVCVQQYNFVFLISICVMCVEDHFLLTSNRSFIFIEMYVFLWKSSCKSYEKSCSDPKWKRQKIRK